MTPRIAESLAHAELIERLTPAMRAAGELIERFRANGVATREKAGIDGWDASPVTEADEAAEILLTDALRAIEPDAVIIGEEASSAGIQPDATDRFWLIDPLDGTRDFVEGRFSYTVNIGLIENGVPTLGLVLHPPSGALWTGSNMLGAWKEVPGEARVAIKTCPLQSPARIVMSQSHPDERTLAWIAQLGPNERTPAGSSLKFCLVAEGSSDLYPRYGRTSEWDTAAADAVLRAAGGMTLVPGGTPLMYGKEKYLNGPLLAIGDSAAIPTLPLFQD